MKDYDVELSAGPHTGLKHAVRAKDASEAIEKAIAAGLDAPDSTLTGAAAVVVRELTRDPGCTCEPEVLASRGRGDYWSHEATCPLWEEERSTNPRPASLTGSWPRAAVAVLEHALARNGSPLVLVDKKHDYASRIDRSRCTLVMRQDGHAWSEGHVPKEGMAVDGIELRVELTGPGDDDSIEQLSLDTDAAAGYEDDDLEIDDVRPIATPAALEENGHTLTTFLMHAFPHIDESALTAKAAALAASTMNRAGQARPGKPFEIDDIEEIGTVVDHDNPVRSELYDAASGQGALTIAEPGQAMWGYLQMVDDSERKRYHLPDTIAALLAWTDGSEDDCESGVQLLTTAEAERIAGECTGAIIDRILDRYRRRGGGDDGHPAHALYMLYKRRQEAAKLLRVRFPE